MKVWKLMGWREDWKVMARAIFHLRLLMSVFWTHTWNKVDPSLSYSLSALYVKRKLCYRYIFLSNSRLFILPILLKKFSSNIVRLLCIIGNLGLSVLRPSSGRVGRILHPRLLFPLLLWTRYIDRIYQQQHSWRTFFFYSTAMLLKSIPNAL